MTYTAGVDIGSTYTKAIIANDRNEIVSRALAPTGFKLADIARAMLDRALADAQLTRADIEYVVSTGFGRHQVDISDAQVTDLTAAARGACTFFPGTRTILDVGGQTMKAIRVDDAGKVQSFRLNDKCAAGTGAFLEKTARYMGYSTLEIGPLVATSKTAVPISGVCAVFAESEVINQLSQGSAPADIMHGAIVSLVGRSVQLMKRVRMEPQFTLVGGILRFDRMVDVVRRELSADVNVAPDELAQFTAAYGAALLAQRRLRRLREHGSAATATSLCTAPST
ncbi:MAG TPA: acyl-CoA dehydratase activase [Longimicrobiales bacterium]|nr:acyl-CoA dehydratase activase [Longimicrobiales bacterium]